MRPHPCLLLIASLAAPTARASDPSAGGPLLREQQRSEYVDLIDRLEPCSGPKAKDWCPRELEVLRQKADTLQPISDEKGFRDFVAQHPGVRIDSLERVDGGLRFAISGPAGKDAVPSTMPGMNADFETATSGVDGWTLTGLVPLIPPPAAAVWSKGLKEPLPAAFKGDAELEALAKRRDVLVRELEQTGLLDRVRMTRFLEAGYVRVLPRTWPSRDLVGALFLTGLPPGPRGRLELHGETATYTGKLAGDPSGFPKYAKDKPRAEGPPRTLTEMFGNQEHWKLEKSDLKTGTFMFRRLPWKK